MRAALLPEQRAFVEDPSFLKAAFCTRRAGKSFAIGMYLFLAASAYPGSSCLYLGLTQGTSQAILNKDVMGIINKQFRLGASWVGSGQEGSRFWRLPNGSVIYLRGADANAYEIAKVVGQKYRIAVLDETSKYRHDVRAMVHGSLLPAMGDNLGTIVLSGTPSNITTGLFYDVTTGTEPGWKVHHWTWRENVFKRANIGKAHDAVVASNPAIVETPLYKQEWLGEWVVDLNALVYKADEACNGCAELPDPANLYTYVLGVDTGFKDATAFIVVAYSEFDPTLYVVHASKESGLIYSSVAERIQAMQRKWSISKIVVDAPLQGAEEMRQRFGLPLDATEKAGKKSVIDLFNSDLLTGRVKLLPGCGALFDEWASLIWDDKAMKAIPAKFIEDGRFDNHLADACLYGWRASRNYTAQPKPEPKPALGTEAWVAEWERREFEGAQRRRKQGNRPILDAPPMRHQADSRMMRYLGR